MEYTKGEWKIAGFSGEHDETGAIIKSGDKVIAHTNGDLNYHSTPAEWQEYYGNANILAASKDMYEACKAALEFMTALDIERKVISGLSLQLNAALNKAEGKGE